MISNLAMVSLTMIPTGTSCNQSVFLDGNEWINIPDMELTGDFTIEAWVKLASGIDVYDTLLGQEGIGPDINFYQQKMRLFVVEAPWDAVTANTLIKENSWTHVAITRLGSDLALYINGTLDANGNWAGTLPIQALGRGNRNRDDKFGQMDEVRIWDVARSADQISLNFNQSVDPLSEGLLRYWTFNPKNGSRKYPYNIKVIY